jgi:CBS domain-containing protein
MMTVADMRTTDLYTLKETDSVYDARRLMMDKNIRHIPILNDTGVLAGLCGSCPFLLMRIWRSRPPSLLFLRPAAAPEQA